MADTYSDDDPDAAAMAAAMGFTGFGMQRGAANKKRKQHDLPSQTGANNAPLGKRRLPMSLPKPVVSGDDGGSNNNNPEEIDLADDEDEDGEGGADVGTTTAAALATVDDATPSTSGPGQQQHHSLPPRPQHHQDHHHHRAPGPGARGGGPAQKAPWWEGAWDPRLIARMVENPWDRLEKQRGLEARGAWPSPSPAAARGGGGGGPVAAAVGPGDNGN
ncbi:hypothetical protein KVR01_007166 [Diaporthe batatas]|uniref:uncharacterized protein n=1 Tax=Diaporthe batatas TaxID=748121 RepID=UPI001D04AF19|nr:uncharacterized protein KVR01_007166 [Diaporthe batatas]KAG8162688.1 hypothetical protein KVR01_007166 [Diaporthe batatas]